MRIMDEYSGELVGLGELLAHQHISLCNVEELSLHSLLSIRIAFKHNKKAQLSTFNGPLHLLSPFARIPSLVCRTNSATAVGSIFNLGMAGAAREPCFVPVGPLVVKREKGFLR